MWEKSKYIGGQVTYHCGCSADSPERAPKRRKDVEKSVQVDYFMKAAEWMKYCDN